MENIELKNMDQEQRVAKAQKQKNTRKFLNLFLAFFFCALGIVMTINCNIGVSPWDVLHIGLAKTVGMTIGQANILVGAMVILFNVILKQPLGFGTVLNIIVIGSIVDLLNYVGCVPHPQAFLARYVMFFLGMVVFSYGTYLYIIQGKGCGPRDGLMQSLNRKTGISPGVIKNIIELIALGLGWYLGGPVGAGTVLYAVTIGFIIQWFFAHNKVDLRTIQHVTILEEIKGLGHGKK